MPLIQNKDLLLHLFLNRITFLRYEEKKFLSKKLDSAHSLALLSIEDISNLLNRKIKNKVIWDGKENLRMAEIVMHRLDSLKIKVLLNDTEDYPENLRQISDPPYVLFCRGNEKILSRPSVSVVGTRRLSQNGKTAAFQFAYDAVKHGCNVVSGLANGADGFAHQGAIDAFYDGVEQNEDLSSLGHTIAVLPSSIDSIVPASHKRMAGQILHTGGCILSEYEPGMEMANWHFVGRNRIIAGLSPSTVVVEAPCGSGALITADFALEYNRDVFFHQAGFEQTAVQISKLVNQQLINDFAVGRISKYKVENTTQKFLEAGASVIKNYEDFCIARQEIPGQRQIPVIQGELFET